MEKWKIAYCLLKHWRKQSFLCNSSYCCISIPRLSFHSNGVSESSDLRPLVGYREGYNSSRCGDHRRYFSSLVPDFQRYPKFSTINSEDISHFKKILGDKGVVQDEDTLDSVNTDWMGKYKGSSKLMLRPKSTEEISQILRYCNSRSLAVVPQGGNTGLVGGSVPVFDEVI